MASPAPAPLFWFPPTLDDPKAGMRAWFFDPVATMAVQVYGDCMTFAAAQFLTTRFENEYRKRYVSQGRKICVAHDWRACASYEPEARDLILQWSRGALSYCDRIVICMSERSSPFVRIAIATGVSITRALGMNIELTKDLTAFCAEVAVHGQQR